MSSPKSLLYALNYRCIPVLDTTAPTLEELVEGAHWIHEAVAQGPVYVHCALGHGRSATLVAAYLLLSGQFTSPDAAVRAIAKQRPGIGLSKAQWDVLRQF